MKVAVCTSAGMGTPWTEITLPICYEYCLRHNYAMVVYCESYRQAMNEWPRLHKLLEQFDLVWMLDADCLITDMNRKIEEVPDLGPHASICEQGLGPHILVNGGSTVWRATDLTHALVDEIVTCQPEWMAMEYNVQQWMMKHHERLADRLKICGTRSFNGCDWGGTSIWQPGDFVYHPCGAPPPQRMQMLRDHLQYVIR